MSAKYRLAVPVFHFRPKLTHPAARSVCDSWATTCYFQEVAYGLSTGTKICDLLNGVMAVIMPFTLLQSTTSD